MDPFENSKPAEGGKFRRAVHGLTAPVKRTYRSFNSPGRNSLLGLAWVFSGVLTVLIPLIYRTIHKKKYRAEYLKYFWEQEYENYAQQRQENYEQYGNSYNNYYNNNNPNYYGQGEYVDVNQCRWWQLSCFSFFVNGEGEPMQDQEWMPAWYNAFSTTEEEREEMEYNLEQPGSLKFVYIWQIVLFLGLGYYGLMVIHQNRNPSGLIIALLVWSNFAFLSMWLMADGSIITEGEQVLRTGFYGQMSVLIFMSNFWYFIHGLAFVLVFWIRSSCLAEKKANEKDGKQTAQAAAAEEKYMAPATTH
eukprot:jgi/Psemu1/290194/fgenesh1_pg.464_\